MDYPKHIYEKVREEVAVSYLKHELRKLFPSIKPEEIENLMESKELSNPRDFWNGLHGVSMGFKLKNILYLATAENIIWSRTEIDINQLTFGVELDQTKVVKPGKVTAEEVNNFYSQNEEIKKIQLENIIKIRGNDLQRETDPIIAIEKMENGKKVISVHDGNGRLARHLLEGKRTNDVFVGKMNGDRLLNYWLPTQLLIDVLFFAYEAIKKKDNLLLEKYGVVLRDMIKDSEVGKYEFLERALTKDSDYREKILEAMGIT